MGRNKSSAELLKIVYDFRNLFSKWDNVTIISKRESCILNFIVFFEEQGVQATTSNLTSIIGITKSATSQVLNKLEDEGYIIRSISREDRRVVFVNLTKKGREYLKYEEENFLNNIDEVLNQMNEEEITSLIHCADKFLKASNIKEISQ